MCYVGKATKIFIFIITVLVITGLILGFSLLKHHDKNKNKSGNNKCENDESCSQAQLQPPIQIPGSGGSSPLITPPLNPVLSPPPIITSPGNAPPPPIVANPNNAPPPPTATPTPLPPSATGTPNAPPPTLSESPPPPSTVLITAPPPVYGPPSPAVVAPGPVTS